MLQPVWFWQLSKQPPKNKNRFLFPGGHFARLFVLLCLAELFKNRYTILLVHSFICLLEKVVIR